MSSILFERRSIRQYKSQQIKESELDYVLKAGIYAPSGRNLQASMIVAVQNSETIAELARLNAAVMGVDTDPFYGATTVAVVFADPEISTHFEDGCLTMGNMLNAAYEIGLGACWIHRAREVFRSEEGKKYMREWGVPENYIGIGNCILGYADSIVLEAAPRKEGRIIKV